VIQETGQTKLGEKGNRLNKNDKNQWLMTGDRINLRKVKESDAGGNYYRWMNDSEVTRFLENGVQRYSIESLREYIKEKNKNSSNLFLAIIIKDGKQHIGNIKLGPINWVHRYGDIGIIIGEKDQWSKGYATEAVSLVVKYAFDKLNLHKITAGCTKLNSGSMKAFQKNGFEIEGVREKHFFWQGKYINGILFGLINNNYEAE